MNDIVILNEQTRFGDETGACLMRNRCAFTSRDMAADWPEAFTYAIVLGWDDESYPEGFAMAELAERYGWDAPLIEFLRDAHTRFEALADTDEGNNKMKYRKKPVVIEASLWDGSVEKASEIIDGILMNGGSATYRCDGPNGCSGTADAHYLVIQTLEGDMLASPGDYIIRGVQGEFYPCKPDIFEATYEVVDDA